MLGEQGLLRCRDRECVASEDELAPEADAQREHVTFRDDDAVKIGLLKTFRELSKSLGLVGEVRTLWRAM